jgi:predicted DNA-binding protein (MmcQ/YjbR family)
MISINEFKKLALSFPGVTEQPHFEKTSFRTKKRIFATLTTEHNRACVKLSPIEQSVFCAFDKTIIYPVNNKWGKQGWTLVELKKIKKSMLKDLLNCAYTESL